MFKQAVLTALVALAAPSMAEEVIECPVYRDGHGTTFQGPDGWKTLVVEGIRAMTITEDSVTAEATLICTTQEMMHLTLDVSGRNCVIRANEDEGGHMEGDACLGEGYGIAPCVAVCD
jgi:hypothetical protein